MIHKEFITEKGKRSVFDVSGLKTLEQIKAEYGDHDDYVITEHDTEVIEAENKAKYEADKAKQDKKIGALKKKLNLTDEEFELIRRA